MTVVYAKMLQGMFPDLKPHVDDLFLLEAHQIAELPDRAPTHQLAVVMRAHPRIARFLISRHPPLEDFLLQLATDLGPADSEDLASCEQALLWEIADWIVYQRDPAGYESGARVEFDLAAVTELEALDGKVVIDAGAGTGRVAFAAAPLARHVFAVEPVATLRRYMRDKAAGSSIDNLFVLDGFLHAIPLPAETADVLVTCQAIGWDLPAELVEIDRVVKSGGIAVHLIGAANAPQAHQLHQSLVDYGYRSDVYEDGGVQILRYWRQTAP